MNTLEVYHTNKNSPDHRIVLFQFKSKFRKSTENSHTEHKWTKLTAQQAIGILGINHFFDSQGTDNNDSNNQNGTKNSNSNNKEDWRKGVKESAEQANLDALRRELAGQQQQNSQNTTK